MRSNLFKCLGSSFLVFQQFCAGAAALTSAVGPAETFPRLAGDCHSPGLSADGRFVVFVSSAENLVTNDHNGDMDVFVRDRVLGRTILVSVNSNGTASGNGNSQDATISSDGRLVVFKSAASNLVATDSNSRADVFVRDLFTGLTTLVSYGYVSANGESSSLGLTPDGRYVLFASLANNLVQPDYNNGVDLFVRDRASGTNSMVTRNYLTSGSQSPTGPVWGTRRDISNDGRFVAFESAANNLVGNDVNARSDVFVRDLRMATNLAVSMNLTRTGLGNGNSGNVSMDATGRYCAFQSLASNLAWNDINTNSDVFWWDRASGVCTLVSVNSSGRSSSIGNATWPVMSRDGRVVVFLSTANDLVTGDTNSVGPDLFRRDIVEGQTTLIEFAPSSGYFTLPVLSSDGQFMLFQDKIGRLVLADTLNGSRDTVAASTPVDDAAMTEDASFVAYASFTSPGGLRNIFLYERITRTNELISVADPAVMLATGFGGAKLAPGSLSAQADLAVFESSSIDFNVENTNLARVAWLFDLPTPSNGPTHLGAIIPEISRGPSRRPVISASGRWIAFDAIPDSTPITGLGARFNLYAYDRIARTNLLVAGVGDPASPSFAALSLDGQALAFQSTESGVGGYSTSGSQVYYRNLAEPTNRLVTLDLVGAAPGPLRVYEPVISPSGRYVAYASYTTDTNTTVSGFNVVLWDSSTTSNNIVSSSETGSLSSQVSRVAFWADGSLLSFQRSRTNYLINAESQALVETLPDTANITLSGDGRLVACERWGSYAPSDSDALQDIYVIDRSTGSNSLVSINQQGFAAGGTAPSISPDGRYVLFTARSPLVTNDLNQVGDVYLRDMLLNRTIILSQNGSGTAAADKLSGNPAWSADSSTILFESHGSDLVTGDYNAARDLFLVRVDHGDGDGDGLADDWELAYFNTLDRSGNGDFDGDGQSDSAESHAGTDPSNSGSVFQVLTCYRPGADSLRLVWSAVPGKTYRVQVKRSVSDPQWADLPEDVLASDSTAMKDDNGVSARELQSFYRVILIP